MAVRCRGGPTEDAPMLADMNKLENAARLAMGDYRGPDPLRRASRLDLTGTLRMGGAALAGLALLFVLFAY